VVGFKWDARGIVLTNSHVVSDCKRATVRFVGQGAFTAEILTKNSGNDLALLRTQARGRAARFRSPNRRVQMGEEVLAFGFPLSGFLSSQGNLTHGDISATTGIRDDVRFLQISAPVQPGNSGGPLMDVGGNVIGVVTAKADAARIAELTGDIPQNVNFAITGTLVMDFLRSHRVRFDTATDARDVGAPRVAEMAQGFAPYIECWQ
jgi:S1-C subfamily serine protease